jgi:sugar lactone lactonase YvrE
VVTTLAGSPGHSGGLDGTGSAARFANPRRLAVDGAGDLWVSDGNQTLRKVTTSGTVTTMAGVASAYGWVDGPAASARFNGPAGLAFVPSGRLAIADEYNHAVRLLDLTQGLSTFAGAPSQAGNVNAFADSARFSGPQGVVVDGLGNAYVADYGNSSIRKVDPTGQTTTLAGTAGLAAPTGLALDAAGNLFITDITNHNLVRITPAGVMSTFAGLAGTPGSADGTGTTARFNFPNMVAVDASGNLFVSETGNHTIRKVTPGGVVTTLAGLAGTADLVDGVGAAARFNMPTGLAVDAGGNLFVGDMNNNRIRKITPAGAVTTLTLSAFINWPRGLAFDAAGRLLVAADQGQAVYSIDTATGTCTLVLGTPDQEGAFPGLLPAGLSRPMGLAFTPQGDLLVTTANGVMLATAP